MQLLECGCVIHGTACSFCKQHSCANPPPGFHPEPVQPQRQSVRETAIDLPTARRGTRQRWNPESGELEDVA